MKKANLSAPSRDAFVFVSAPMNAAEGDALQQKADLLFLFTLLRPLRNIGKFRTNHNVKNEVV